MLPEYITKNRHVVGLVKDEHHSTPYDDNLCLFRCLALHKGYNYHNINKPAKALLQTYQPGIHPKAFLGVKMNELSKVEKVFRVNIEVWELKPRQDDEVEDEDEDEDEDEVEDEVEDDDTVQVHARIIRRSNNLFDETLYVNLFENHYSFITSIEHFCKTFQCRVCSKLFKKPYELNRHETTCQLEVNHKFVGGYYKPTPTVFDMLKNEGIVFPEQLRYYPYRATFDFECYFEKDNLPKQTAKVVWEARHVPLSVSVCSNVPGHTDPECFVTEGDSEKLIEKLLVKLHQISITSLKLLMNQYENVFKQLKAKIKTAIEKEPSEKKHPLEILEEKLCQHLMQLPVIGFNSSRYDMNLIKRFLLPQLRNDIDFVIKKNNEFTCITTPSFKFLDIVNYLAPGHSYSKYLRAYGCTLNKGFFPYEWIDSLEKLRHDKLPEKEVFYSSLKNEGISDDDYAYLQQVWTEQNMKTVRDLLIWYNNLDVLPFLQALEKQFAFYTERGVDPFKEAISVPGLTLKYLFKTVSPDVTFSLFKEKHKELYYKIKENIVGGPSIVFSRYHEKDVTKIRPLEYGTTCKGCVGYDANALYLWALQQEMPTGSYVFRSSENHFKPERADTVGFLAYDYLTCVAQETGHHIQHAFNGTEKRLGRRRIPVDGWCAATQTVYQFHGCYYHGHECLGKDYNELRKAPMATLRKNTSEITDYLRNLGYKVVEMWECDWKKMRRTPFLKHNSMTEEEILKRVQTRELFGTVECDIEVPENLKKYFSEMTPIFKNTTVRREDIGPLMENFARQNKVMSQPRRCLIGSYFGKKILLTTPLLHWYLEHGLKVTKIYSVIEWKPSKCFKAFGDAVSEARRDGDKDPAKGLIAETMKLLGNSGYGKTVTNKEMHRDVKYVYPCQASSLVNEKRFRQQNIISDQLVEVEMMKQTIRLDLPIQIGYFVYQYAKLRMLEFYYDFLDKYLDRKDFEMCEMDTDSAYLALAAPDMEQLVRPELKREFYEERSKWLPAEACDVHVKDYINCRALDQHWTAAAECCKNRIMFDKRTPGLFKVEWRGEGIVSLCSKTYYCFGEKNKATTKGLNKQQNFLNKEVFLDVLKNQCTGSGTNKGFRVVNNTMYTYTQRRDALTYFYPKRIVEADGVSTSPLMI